MSYSEMTFDVTQADWGDGSTSGDWIAGKYVLTIRSPGFCVRLRGRSTELRDFLAAGIDRFIQEPNDGP